MASSAISVILKPQLLACNDSNIFYSGSYQVTDADTNEVFFAGNFQLAPGQMQILASRKICTTQRRMLLIKWQLQNGSNGCNHALCGNPQFDLTQYRSWLTQIAALDNSFDAESIG